MFSQGVCSSLIIAKGSPELKRFNHRVSDECERESLTLDKLRLKVFIIFDQESVANVIYESRRL